MNKKSFSWGIIVLLFILFFPVGIWMLYKKMTDEKLHCLKNGKSLRVFGWVVFGLGLFYLFFGELGAKDGSSALSGMIFTLLLFFVGGLFMVFKGKQFMDRGAKYNRYVTIVCTSNNTWVDSIAAAYPATYESAVSDLQMMIDAGYFPNAYIDLKRRMLVMPVIQSTDYNVSNPVSSNLTTDAKPRSVKCPNCGAVNSRISNAVNECEYCGSPLT